MEEDWGAGEATHGDAKTIIGTYRVAVTDVMKPAAIALPV